VLASGSAGAASVAAVVGGANVGSATTGANGYYYILAPAGTIGAGSSVLVYTTAAGDTGNVTLFDALNLTVGSAAAAGHGSTAGVTTSGAVMLSSAGSLTIASGARVSGANPVLSAGSNFINNEGSDAVTATTGRWLIYSSDPASNTFGGLDSANTAVWNASLATLSPGAVTQTGNRYLFAFQPTLTFTVNDLSKVYGADASAQVATDFTVTGVQAGVAGAFLGDTAASVFSGAPILTSSGAAATASVAGSPYAIDIAAGSVSLTALNGYGSIQFVSGQLTVTARPITVTADPQSRANGAANPALTFTVGGDGLVNGDTLSGGLATDATSASPAGSYAITQGSLAASANYMLTYVGGVLTVEAPPSAGGPGAGLLTVGTSPSSGPGGSAAPDASRLTSTSMNTAATGSTPPVISGSDPANWGAVLDNGSSSQTVLLEDPRFANAQVCVTTDQPSACTATQ
jgi:hypothetical protein